MKKESGLDEKLALIERLVDDQLFLIDTRLKELDPSPDGKKSATAALRQLREISELQKALLGMVREGTGESSE